MIYTFANAENLIIVNSLNSKEENANTIKIKNVAIRKRNKPPMLSRSNADKKTFLKEDAMIENRCHATLDYKCTRNPAKECKHFEAKIGEPLSCVSLTYNCHCKNETARAEALKKFEETQTLKINQTKEENK